MNNVHESITKYLEAVSAIDCRRTELEEALTAVCKHCISTTHPITVNAVDNLTFRINVYCVEDEYIREFKDIVHDLDTILGTEGDFVFLPHIVDVDTTKEHYPQHYVEKPALETAKDCNE